MLHCSSIRGPSEIAALAPQYSIVLCHAIAQLSIPDSEMGKIPQDSHEAEEWAFQAILGLLLAGLLSEARVRETGIWISIAYRLILEHCQPSIEERSREWEEAVQWTADC